MGCCCTKSSPDVCADVIPKETFTTVIQNPVLSPDTTEHISPTTNTAKPVDTPRRCAQKAPPTQVPTPRPTLVKPSSPVSINSSCDSFENDLTSGDSCPSDDSTAGNIDSCSDNDPWAVVE